MKKCLVMLLIVLFASGISAAPKKVAKKMPAIKQEISIKSPAFKEMEYLPAKYTGIGEGKSPPLIFENVPASAKSLVMTMEDPDAPYGTYDHWIIFNIPPKTKTVKEGSTPKGASKGKNSAQDLGYVSPYPPRGKPHHYLFKLSALDIMLKLNEGADRKQIEKAMEGHIISQASLIGLFIR